MAGRRDGVSNRLRLGIVGCGAISGAYGAHIGDHASLELVAATDADPSRAEEFARVHGGRAVDSLDELLDVDVDVVVNLTPPALHHEVSRRALEAGRHVHSEKPLARSSASAWELVELAASAGVRLSCSPFTQLGEGQQTAGRMLREGRIGRVRAVYAETDWGRLESWHPSPAHFYEVGPVVDVGIYPLSVVTAFLGPVRSVQAVGRTLLSTRVTIDGGVLELDGPDTWFVVLDLHDGTVVRLTSSFYTGQQSRGHAAIAFHGDEGSLWLDNSVMFDGEVSVAAFGNDEPHVPAPFVRADPPMFDWARGLLDLQDAIEGGVPHRASGEQAAHLVDVLAAVERSYANGGTSVGVDSTFPLPRPMDWAVG
jgi:predicted dehydrogenase